jgi:hypothetical protein
MLGCGQAEALRNPRDAPEAVVGGGFAPDGAAAEPGQNGIRMRALDDEVPDRPRQSADDGLITPADDPTPGSQVRGQPGFELRIDDPRAPGTTRI